MQKMTKEIHQALKTLGAAMAPPRLQRKQDLEFPSKSIAHEFVDVTERPTPERLAEANRILERLNGRQLFEAIYCEGQGGQRHDYF